MLERKTIERRDQNIANPNAPNAPYSNLVACLAMFFVQNFNTSAGRWAQPCLPIKLVPNLFCAIAISFLSAKSISPALMTTQNGKRIYVCAGDRYSILLLFSITD
jgi:hypothetical protein